MTAADLPVGTSPDPVALPHFPDALHAVVWRNWRLVPHARLAAVLGATAGQIAALGEAMGLPPPPAVTDQQWRRSALTIIKRNWHLLPYEQLLELLGWTAEEMAYVLREDDFLFVKLGHLKPRCAPVRYADPSPGVRQAVAAMAPLAREVLAAAAHPVDPLFSFVERLSAPLPDPDPPRPGGFAPRYCYSYFALYGDPLLDREADPFPEGYLARLGRSGADGVWLQGVLYKLAPFPWEPGLSARWEERLENLRLLAERARRHGMAVYVYLNEPRCMPASFFERHPELRGAPDGEYAALCTSVPEVREYLSASVERIARAAPGLGGFFTISASENATNCWSHGRGAQCPRCASRTPAEVIAEVNDAIAEGLRRSGTNTRLIVWDWGWDDGWAAECIRALPGDVSFMSVSEWSIPLRRGGVESVVGEYSISAIGPGPRASRHWAVARERGLPTLAKIQANITWELSAVPHLPAVANVAEHVARLREAGVSGLMLGWTLGGHPSPNLEVVAELGREPKLTAAEAMLRVAARRFGEGAADEVVAAWQECSRAFSEFPYHGGTVYNAPLQVGPANLLWSEPTGYRATMVGFPYDDLRGWRQVYPPEVFAGQLELVAGGFERALAALREAVAAAKPGNAEQAAALADELRMMEAAAVHFRSVANQSRFVMARDAAAGARGADLAPLVDELDRLVRAEEGLARRLLVLQAEDARIGFEASNQYYYVAEDLAEKVLCCRRLLEEWLPELRRRAREEAKGES